MAANISITGGDQNFADVTTIADRLKKQIPTDRNPIVVTLPLYDDPSLGWYATVYNVSESATTAAFRMTTPNGAKLVANGYWGLQTVPTVEDSTLRGSITITFSAAPTRYNS